jgi:S-adenosylmethionine decarboxylase
MTHIEASSYGTHLLMLLSGIERREALDSPEGLCTFLSGLVVEIGMRVLDGPKAVTEEAEPDKYGHSAVVILYESHAAVHTYPARASLFLDLFSCKPFDESKVLGACHTFLGHFEVAERLVLDRGAHWNGTAAENLPTWTATREKDE